MRALVGAVAAALCLGAAAGATAAEPSPEVAALLAAGDAAMQALDTAKAAEAYEKAADLAPERYDAAARATLALRDAGDELKARGDKAAEGYFERASARAKDLLARFPDRAEAHYLAASTSGQLALYRGAREKVRLSREIEREAKAAIALDPSDGRPHAVLGVYYREVANANGFTKMLAKTLLGGLPDGTNEDSVRELRRAVEIDPKDLYATFELARTYRVMKKADEEKAALHAVLELPVRFQRDPRLKTQAEARLAAIEAR